MFSSTDTTYHADRCERLRQAAAAGRVRLEALARRGYPGRELPARMLPEMSTVGFWDAPGDQDWGLDWHRNEGIELTYLSRGRLDFAVDDGGRLAAQTPATRCQKYLLENGHLTITRPWQAHRVGNPNVRASRLHWLILDLGVRRPNQAWHWPDWLILSPADLTRLTQLLRHNEQPVWRADEHIGRCFEQLAQLAATRDPAATQTRLQLHLNELFVTLLEMLKERQVRLDEHLSSSRRTVELFLGSLSLHAGEPWTLETMAQQCGLGRTRFADYCRQITNVSPMDYLAQSRIEAARRLMLEQPHKSLTDVALECGFQTSQYFSTVFHQKTGMSPRAFREQGINRGKPS
jgi:AraC family L-rhamnose operon regulatory protein RhaS